MMSTFKSAWKESYDREGDKPPRVRSFLVIHQGALGDFILGLPALETLRRAFPGARSVIMGYPRILELVEKRFYADDILSVDQKEMASFFVPEGSLDPGLSQFLKGFDLIVVFGREGDGTVVHNLKRVCEGDVLHVHSFPPQDERVHLTDHLLGQFAQFGLCVSQSPPRLYLKESDREWGMDFWKERGVTSKERSETVVLHPGSGSRKKVWPLDRFVGLAHTIHERLGSRILIVLGPAEGPEVQKTFEGMGPASFVLASGLSLLQLASVVEGCRLFAGNDSGVSHLAAALGLPTVAIFGPTDQKVWAPRGEKALVVSKRLRCSPCLKERFSQCKDMECLRGIEMEDVFEGVKRVGIGLGALRL
jgi:ADP-heptose:LPS heptosyltransferase